MCLKRRAVSVLTVEKQMAAFGVIDVLFGWVCGAAVIGGMRHTRGMIVLQHGRRGNGKSNVGIPSVSGRKRKGFFV
jgi:hypothetical protein